MVVNGWFDGINVWKINTWGEFISYALVILTGVLVFFLIIRRINRNRRPDVAQQRVAKKLKKLGGKGSRVYTNFTLRTFAGDTPFEMLWVARDRLYVVKVIAQGTRIAGSASGSTWRLDGSVKDTIKNPLPALENQRRALLPYLSAKGFEDILVEPMVICSDTYETPRFKIDGFTSIYTYKYLGAWRRKFPLAKRLFFDVDKVCALLEDAMLKNDSGN
ncbi:MAG: NERD domain-containing protein [Clostridia bacterium]|nr:NERD domain-containing protein [Clostridia bacterium]